LMDDGTPSACGEAMLLQPQPNDPPIPEPGKNPPAGDPGSRPPAPDPAPPAPPFEEPPPDETEPQPRPPIGDPPPPKPTPLSAQLGCGACDSQTPGDSGTRKAIHASGLGFRRHLGTHRKRSKLARFTLPPSVAGQVV
jgi:hypothetical protein